uniref:Uncharacterized protein n=1 Tax=Oryza meridionalis TaxID=40149 RepID=A0A0E0DXT2_9ORYZ
MEKICLPSPIFNLGAAGERIHMFPALERRVFSLDQSGRGFLLEADTSRLVMLPHLHKPKLEPIALYIPGAEIDLDDLDGGGGGDLFIMEKIAKPHEADCHLFEALVYRVFCSSYLSKSWDCQLLPPPPPYVAVKCGVRDFLKICSYGLVEGGSEICISIDVLGLKWLHELKLWLGFSPNDGHFAAADLSTLPWTSTCNHRYAIVGANLMSHSSKDGSRYGTLSLSTWGLPSCALLGSFTPVNLAMDHQGGQNSTV